MNLVKFIITAASVTGAAMSGGLVAAIGALGGIAGNRAINILEPIMDYAILDPENGYYKDFPEGKKDSYLKRFYKMWSYKEEDENETDN